MTARAASPVLFVNAAAERGGAETVLLSLLRHLDRDRFPPYVCCLRDGPFIEELRRQAGLEAAIVPSGGFRHVGSGLKAVRRLRRLLVERGASLVHCNGTGAHLYGGMAARLARVPAVYHVHDLPEAGWNTHGLIERAARLVPAAVAVAPSSFLAAELARCQVRPRRIVAIPNGVDTGPELARPAVPGPRGQPSEPQSSNAPTAVWCGRLQRWKGTHVFLRAAANVRRAMPDARFVVVGGTIAGLEPAYASELRGLVASLNLGDAVLFAGHQDDVRPYVDRADVVVHSSTRPEPFGLVVLEAMAAGKPVVASAAGGPLEIVEPEITGLLVQPGDVDALAEAMLRLFRDAALRARLGKAGRARAERHFSAAAMTRRFEALYASLVEGAAVPGAEAR